MPRASIASCLAGVLDCVTTDSGAITAAMILPCWPRQGWPIPIQHCSATASCWTSLPANSVGCACNMFAAISPGKPVMPFSCNTSCLLARTAPIASEVTVMRSIVFLFALLVLINPASAKLKLFACEPEWAALAEELGGDLVEIFTATTAQQDPHHIQARPALIAQLRRADLAVCTGAELEAGWLPMLQRRANNPRVAPGSNGFLEAAALVPLREKPQRLDRADGD